MAKFTINALVARDIRNDKIIDLIGITDSYSEVDLEYPYQLVTVDDIISWGKKVYGDRCYSSVARYLDCVTNGRNFTMQSEAKDLPSIGYMKVRIEEVEVEVE